MQLEETVDGALLRANGYGFSRNLQAAGGDQDDERPESDMCLQNASQMLTCCGSMKECEQGLAGFECV